jgi:hypothetical protein
MRSRLRALLAVIVVCTATGAVIADAVTRPSARTLAERKLAADRYTDVALGCKAKNHRTTCTWTGVREQSRCDGTVVVARKREKARARVVRLSGTRCRPVLYGFNTYTNDRTVGLQQKTGSTVFRQIVPWDRVEPIENGWNWTEFDIEYETAIKAGFRPLIIATAAPCWARGSTDCAGSAITGPPDVAHDARWREYIRRLAARYPRALGIEIWNEPNLRSVWWPRPDPARFAELLAQAYATIKALDPKMMVISGGLLAHGSEGVGQGGMGDLTFMRGMMQAGAGTNMDALGVHPYPLETTPDGKPSRWNPDVAVRTMGQLRGIAAEFGVKKPIWITEVGESTATQAGFPAAITPDEQARDLKNLMRYAVLARDIDVVIIHTLGDAPRDAGQNLIDNALQPAIGISIFYNGVNSGFGVFDSADRPKPAACVLSRALGGTLHCP